MSKAIRTTMRINDITPDPAHLPLYLSPDDGYVGEPSEREARRNARLDSVYVRILKHVNIEFWDGGDSGRDQYHCNACDGTSPETHYKKGKLIYWAKEEDIKHEADCLYVEAQRWFADDDPLHHADGPQ